jgi:hypothetical protein
MKVSAILVGNLIGEKAVQLVSLKEKHVAGAV